MTGSEMFAAVAGDNPGTPVLLFDCELPNGDVERWSTHAVSAGGAQYEAVVLRYNSFELKTAAEDAIDGIPRLSVTLSNVDSRFSEIERAIGFKGARAAVRFSLAGVEAIGDTNQCVVFQGIASAPEEITDDEIRLVFTSRLTAQRSVVPDVRIQRRCPWSFPRTASERAKTVEGAACDRYSRFYPCGYSPDCQGGVGNLQGGEPYTSCAYTREDCEARGMFDHDERGNVTRRFGGVEYLPSTIQVKSHGESGMHPSAVYGNDAKYNDTVPLIYGTAWCRPPVIFARNDGNLTHVELLLSLGAVTAVHTVVVNGTEVPRPVEGTNMSSSGWYKNVSAGERSGNFNAVFTNSNGQPVGDPYGGMTVLAVAVPTAVYDGKGAPRVQVLLSGIAVPEYSEAGMELPARFSNNPAWVLLDLLKRSGWRPDELNIASFATAGRFCEATITTVDLNGRQTVLPRFGCNLVLRARRSLREVIRGIRKGSGLFLRYDDSGRLELCVESSLAVQQPNRSEYSNAREPLGGGWPAYEFGDGSGTFGDIVCDDRGRPEIRFWCRGTSDTPNRVSVEFQDQFNDYQQDSLSLVELGDALRAEQEITAVVPALGIPNFAQASRVLRTNVLRSVEGNTYVEFRTGLRAFGVRPGDLITLTYLRHGYNRQLFRVVRFAPGLNYETALITAQIHKDEWYREDTTTCAGQPPGRQPMPGDGLPRPLCGVVQGTDGEWDFRVNEESVEGEGSSTTRVTVEFASPPALSVLVGPPTLSLIPRIRVGEGSLPAGSTLYYAFAAVDGEGREGPLSFATVAAIPEGTQGAAVEFTRLMLPKGSAGFSCYRGANPSTLVRVTTVNTPEESFIDAGAQSAGGAPPDLCYDHANFYWRSELLPESNVSHATRTNITIGAGSLSNAFVGQTLRITRGKGRGQERSVAAVDQDSITVAPALDVVPDATSSIVIAQATMQTGGASVNSPARFEVPNRSGAYIHVIGRAANAANQESPLSGAVVTRWRIGGTVQDTGVPDAPVFGVGCPGQGAYVVSGIGFGSATNVLGITSATFTLAYCIEATVRQDVELALDLGAEESRMNLLNGGTFEPGTVLQIGAELVRVLDSDNQGASVERGVSGTAAEAHPAGETVYPLARRTSILPFPKGFFGTPASGVFEASFQLPGARIAAAELFATNSYGNGEAGAVAFTHLADRGLRTLSGGQYNLQVPGPLAIQRAATAPLVVDQSCLPKDVYATIGTPSTECPITVAVTRNGSGYCTLTILPGECLSNVVAGRELSAISEGDKLTLDVVSVGRTATSMPGKDLTVTIRL